MKHSPERVMEEPPAAPDHIGRMVGAAPTLSRLTRSAVRAAVAFACCALLFATGSAGAARAGRALDTSPPSTPTGLTIAATGQTSMTLFWSASTDNVGVKAYRVFRSGTQVAAGTTRIYVFSGLSCATTYTLGVAAIDAAGNVSQQATITGATRRCGATTTTMSTTTTTSTTTPIATPVDTTPPSTPSQLSTSAVSATTITLSWLASTDNVKVAGYRVYRGGSQIGNPTTTSYVFAGLQCGTSYTLGVVALDAAGNASPQATMSVTTSQCPTATPLVGGSAAAVLWVGQGGSGSGVRAASPVGFAQALAGGNVCDSGPTAYVRARLGDTVLLAGGTYTSPWDFTPQMSKQGAAGSCDYNYGGQANLSGCVSFQPAPGQTVVFQVAGASAIRICANFVSIRGVTINQTTYTDQFGDTVSNGSMGVGAGDNSCLPGGAPPHDVYLANNSYGGQASALGGASNVWFVGGTATGTSDFPWQMGGQGANGATAYANHNGIVGITFQGGNFANTDPGHHHMECVHDTPGSDHIVIAGSRFISCPVESFFAQGNSQTNILVENNYFINGGPLKFDCTSNNCVNSGIVVRNNSFSGAGLQLENACNVNGACSGAVIDNNLVYGNTGLGCAPIAVNFGLAGATGSGWTFQNTACAQSTGTSSSTGSSSTGAAPSGTGTSSSPARRS